MDRRRHVQCEVALAQQHRGDGFFASGCVFDIDQYRLQGAIRQVRLRRGVHGLITIGNQGAKIPPRRPFQDASAQRCGLERHGFTIAHVDQRHRRRHYHTGQHYGGQCRGGHLIAGALVDVGCSHYIAHRRAFK
ncbi:hypothetical protein D3C76_887920 [compost metagenome]